MSSRRPQTTSQEPEPLQRRLRPRKNKDTSSPSNVLRVNQEAVFAIPELMDLISGYLTKDDFRVVILVCRAWNAFWIPYLYSKLFFRKYKRTRNYPKMLKYGPSVKSIELYQTKWNNIVHLLDYATNIQSLSINTTPLTDLQLRILTEMAPQLRSLHVEIGRYMVGRAFRTVALPCSLHIVAAWTNLEDLDWQVKGTLRVDDILHVLKSCTRLKSLALCDVYIVDELPDGSTTGQETLIKVDDDGWKNIALRSLRFNGVFLGDRQFHDEESKYVHPCLRRLLQHAPNLKTIKFSQGHNLSPLDWDNVFEGRSIVEHVELFAQVAFRNPGFHTSKALGALAKSCRNLKVFEVRSTNTATDEDFERVMLVNRRLQKVVVRHTDFGNQALTALARPETQPFGMSVVPNCLAELDLEGCNITHSSVAVLLENSNVLRELNLAGTAAGTLELFKGNKPWPCTKTLEKLRMDIQPVGFQPRRVQFPVATIQPLDPIKFYTPEEYLLIKERLHSFTSLVALKLGGEGMSFDLMDSISFAPGLRTAILSVPFIGEESNQRYNLARKAALDRGAAMFPNWTIMARAFYIQSRLSCMITAGISKEFMQF